jgi:hypothetical protein
MLILPDCTVGATERLRLTNQQQAAVHKALADRKSVVSMRSYDRPAESSFAQGASGDEETI